MLLQRFEHISPIHLCECNDIYTESTLFLSLSVLSLLKKKPPESYAHLKVNVQQVLNMHQFSYKITVCACFPHIHTHTHAVPPHPFGIPVVSCCLPQSSALQHRLSPKPSTSPLLSWDWNLNPDTWFLSNTDRSKPCIGTDLVKPHRMVSVAGGITPGIAMDHPEGSIAKCQSSGFMNAMHRVPRLLAFSKACYKSLPSSSMHTLKEKVHFFLTALSEQY